MGDLTVTPAQVQPVAGGSILNGFMGEDGDAGEAVYLDSVANKWKLENADIDTSGSTQGVLEATAANGQPCVVLHEGDIDLGVAAAPVEGVVYGISPTPGNICPVGDALMVAGKYRKVLGVGKAGNKIAVKPQSTDSKVQ